MNNSTFYSRLASLALVIGIFFAYSCSSTEQIATSEKEMLDDTEVYSQELDRINAYLSEDPNNDSLILEKANVLEKLALSYSSPQPRNVIYQNIRDLKESPNTSLTLKNNELNELLVRNWNNEQSKGVELLQGNEQNLEDDTFNTVVAHFENAITLIPDSTVTYTLLATTYYRNGLIINAIDKLKEAENFYDEPNPELKEKLAFLYLESGDIEQSIELYKMLTDAHPDDAHLKHGLANAYMLNNQHVEAVDKLRALAEQYPTRYNYLESLATELFYIFRDELNYAQNMSSNSGEIEKTIQNALDKMEEVESIYDTLSEKLPQNEQNVFRMASTFKNASALLSSISNIDKHLQTELSERITHYLEMSKQYWERLIEISPDNTDYYNNLYQVYLKLEMNEEAENIERKFNF